MRRLLAIAMASVWLAGLAGLAGSALAAGLDEAVGHYQRGNFAEAAKQLKPLAEQGNAIAQLLLGDLLLQGRGVPQNHAEAAKLLRKSADQGMPEAQSALGMLYLKGHGVGRDERQAASWFRKAAEQNDPDGQINLGICYATGKGTEKDLVKAHMWLNLGTAQLKGRERKDAVKLREAIAKQLAPAQLAQAQDQAQKWKPSGAGAKPATAAAAPAKPEAKQPDQGAPKPPPPRLSVGSGFFITAEGHVLTNHHVIDGCREVGVRQAHGALWPGKVTVHDKANDLAVVKAETRPPGVLAFRDGGPIRAGDGVVVLGYPYGDLLAREVNVSTGTVNALAGIRNDPRHLQLSAPIQPGNSGGPVVDLAGHVVAVVQSSLGLKGAPVSDQPQNVNFAIKAELAEKLLAANRVPFQKAAGKRKLAAATVAEKARAAVVLVECRN